MTNKKFNSAKFLMVGAMLLTSSLSFACAHKQVSNNSEAQTQTKTKEVKTKVLNIGDTLTLAELRSTNR